MESERMEWRRGQRKLLSARDGDEPERLDPGGLPPGGIPRGDPGLEARGVEEPRGVRRGGRAVDLDGEARLQVSPAARARKDDGEDVLRQDETRVVGVEPLEDQLVHHAGPPV